MKKMLIIVLLVLTNYSCSDSDKEVGKSEDNIGLSQKEFQVDAERNSILITTEGDSWWISEIFFQNGEIFDISETDTTAENFIITKSDFTIERKNGKEISIEIFENTSNSQRTFFVGLQAGNYFDGISITQSSE